MIDQLPLPNCTCLGLGGNQFTHSNSRALGDDLQLNITPFRLVY